MRSDNSPVLQGFVFSVRPFRLSLNAEKVKIVDWSCSSSFLVFSRKSSMLGWRSLQPERTVWNMPAMDLQYCSDELNSSIVLCDWSGFPARTDLSQMCAGPTLGTSPHYCALYTSNGLVRSSVQCTQLSIVCPYKDRLHGPDLVCR